MEVRSVREARRRHKNRAAAPIGALVLILAFVGLVALVVMGTNMTRDLLDQSREKEKFEKIIQPVLMFDPPPFDDITTLTNKSLLESALWATMLGEKRETYTFDAQSNLVVPSSDVDVTSAKLFGTQVKLDHQSFASDFGISYDYDESRNAYLVPVASASALYTPRVDEISRAGDVYSLLVGYIPPSNAWNADISGETEPSPHKFMVYKMKRIDNFYQLVAIEDPPPEKQVTYANPSVFDGGIADVQEQLPPDTEPVAGEESAPDSSVTEDGAASDASSEEESGSGDESQEQAE